MPKYTILHGKFHPNTGVKDRTPKKKGDVVEMSREQAACYADMLVAVGSPVAKQSHPPKSAPKPASGNRPEAKAAAD